MTPVRRLAASAAGVLLALPVFALAAEGDAARAEAAQIAVLAELAPLACPDIKADDAAVTAFMARAQISQRDLSTRYRSTAIAMVSALKQSTEQDRDAACDRILQRLGEDGLGLVGEGGSDGTP